MTHITEDQLEQAALDWFRELGYQAVFGPDIAPPPDGVAPERDNYRQTILMERLKTRLRAIIQPFLWLP
jgi:type I restriction enzyme R subunit